MKKTVLNTLFIFTAIGASAQAVHFDTDDVDRGYTDRPYLRYEAEDGFCNASANVIYNKVETYDQGNLAVEASNLQAALLPGNGDWIEWTLDKKADALTIRFSLPDSADGKGTRQTVAIYDGDTRLCDVELDSYWAWQYILKTYDNEKVPNNTPADNRYPRMRFDEVNLLLPSPVEAGHRLRIVRESDAADPMTIDFVETEYAGPALTFADITDADKVEFTGDGSTLQSFINSNQGKTIFIPAGRYTVPSGIEIKGDGTRLIGAGMWHTTIYFSASSDNKRTYNRRGITCNRNNCAVENLSLNTINNKRYFEENSAYQVGKGFMGSWGTNSTIRNVRVDHFECGAWIADYSGNSTNGLTVSHCRFRNNYADGINLCSGVGNTTVSHCSFRNNGDDDQASWSTGNWSHDNLFDHNTAENNWRASSLGFFGGRNNHATNIAIFDAMEAGARITADFSGTGFSTDGEILFENISIYRSGTLAGACGYRGDFWGNAASALRISAGYHYDVNNVRLHNIDLYSCRNEGVRVTSSNSKRVNNLTMDEIHVYNQLDNGLSFMFANGLKGNGTGHNLLSDDPLEYISSIPSGFDFTITSAIGEVTDDATAPLLSAAPGSLTNISAQPARIYTTHGQLVCLLGPGETLYGISDGIYIAKFQKGAAVKTAVTQ